MAKPYLSERARKFSREVGIIVLGVLIALVAQQLVEQWSIRQDMQAAKTALRADHIAIVANARERMAEDACLRRRLEQVAVLLDGSSGRLPATGEIGSPPSRGWYPVSWASTATSRLAAELPRDDLIMFGEVARNAKGADDIVEKELDDWAQIYRVVGPARPVSEVEIAQIRSAIARAAYALNMMRLVAPQLQQMVMERHLLTHADLVAADRQTHVFLTGNNYRAICGPIGAVPARRVTAPYDPSVQGDPLTGNPLPGQQADVSRQSLPRSPSPST